MKVFAFASKNQSLIDKLKNIEKDNKILEKLLANDRYTKDLTQFINKDNFCSKYLSFGWNLFFPQTIKFTIFWEKNLKQKFQKYKIPISNNFKL